MRHVTALGATLALLAVGCTDMVHEPAATAPPTTDGTVASDPSVDPAPPAGPGAGGPDPGGTLAGETAPVEVPTPSLLHADPLARTTHPLTELGGALEIELRAEPLDELLRVAVTFTPRGIEPGRVPLTTLLGADGTHETITARLVDPVHLVEYRTVRPAVAPSHLAPAHVDHPTTLMFYFAAPVEPLDTADFLLDLSMTVPDWPGFLDVPFGAA